MLYVYLGHTYMFAAPKPRRLEALRRILAHIVSIRIKANPQGFTVRE